MQPDVSSPTRLVIIRHGNTFGSGDVVRRVGGKTDLPLVDSGIQQAKRLGQYFSSMGMMPAHIFVGPLVRTQQTAAYMLAGAGWAVGMTTCEALRELDYGVDENQPEEVVVARLGKLALLAWDEAGIVPDGWDVDVAGLRASWDDLAAHVRKVYPHQTVWVVTSNGIARFALDLVAEKKDVPLKLPTGGYGILTAAAEKGFWEVDAWGLRP